MKLCMIGTGYVGLVSGVCFSDVGNTVYCVDKDKKKIEELNKGNVPIYEPGLEEILKKNYKQNRLKFTTDLKKAVSSSDIIFICPTPKVVSKYFEEFVSKQGIEIKHISAESTSSEEFEKSKRSLYACSDLALVTSGTVVLELAKANVPMVVGYRTGFLTQVIYRLFINISSANLINLITKKNDIPEFLFYKCNYKNLYSEAEKILVNKKQAESQLISSKQAIRELGYGTKDPSIRAAKSIKNYFKLQ